MVHYLSNLNVIKFVLPGEVPFVMHCTHELKIRYSAAEVRVKINKYMNK